MLEPQTRLSTYEILRPPTGFALDCLVATTYSASLATVLSLPAGMLADLPGASARDAGVITAAELAALKRVCDRTVIFCQMGGIYPAEFVSPAIIEAEEMVREMRAPNGGSFHPKVWVVRFRQEEKKKRDLLRIAIMSRNLTADRSWDAGVIMEAQVEVGDQKPNDLGRLMRHLAGRCARPLDVKREKMVLDLADEVEKARWKAPTGKGSPDFHLIGDSSDRGWHQPKSQSLAIVSPFLTSSAIRKLSETASSPIMILSRPDALIQCWPTASAQFERQMILSPPGDDQEASARTGLHAKMLFWKQGATMRIAIGSMNATSAAISGRNVEFMVSFTCPTTKEFAEIDDLLARRHLGSVIEDFEPAVASEPIPEKFDERPPREALIAGDLHLECKRSDDGWRLFLVPGSAVMEQPDLLPGLRFRPVTLGATRAAECGDALLLGKAAAFPGTLDLSEITGFTAFEANGPDGPFGFVLNLAIRGVDDGERQTAALKSLLPNERTFAEFLRTFLGDFKSLEHLASLTGDRSQHGVWNGTTHTGLLEMLIRCASDEPDRLTTIVQTFEAIGEVQLAEVTSNEFRKLWAAVLQSTQKKA